jgi:hypothetical protein
VLIFSVVCEKFDRIKHKATPSKWIVRIVHQIALVIWHKIICLNMSNSLKVWFVKIVFDW